MNLESGEDTPHTSHAQTKQACTELIRLFYNHLLLNWQCIDGVFKNVFTRKPEHLDKILWKTTKDKNKCCTFLCFVGFWVFRITSDPCKKNLYSPTAGVSFLTFDKNTLTLYHHWFKQKSRSLNTSEIFLHYIKFTFMIVPHRTHLLNTEVIIWTVSFFNMVAVHGSHGKYMKTVR